MRELWVPTPEEAQRLENILAALASKIAILEAKVNYRDRQLAEIADKWVRIAELEKKIAYYEAPLPVGEGGKYTNANDHRFSDEGICVRCGEDAENWDGGCVESLVNDLVDAESKLAAALAANAKLTMLTPHPYEVGYE